MKKGFEKIVNTNKKEKNLYKGQRQDKFNKPKRGKSRW